MTSKLLTLEHRDLTLRHYDLSLNANLNDGIGYLYTIGNDMIITNTPDRIQIFLGTISDGEIEHAFSIAEVLDHGTLDPNPRSGFDAWRERKMLSPEFAAAYAEASNEIADNETSRPEWVQRHMTQRGVDLLYLVYVVGIYLVVGPLWCVSWVSSRLNRLKKAFARRSR